MKAPIERRHQKDKRLLPLRGDGNIPKNTSQSETKVIGDELRTLSKSINGGDNG